MSKAIVFGYHAVHALISKSPNEVQTLFLQANRKDQKLQALIQIAKQHNIKVQQVDKAKLDEWMEPGSNHQGVVAKIHSQEQRYQEADIESILQKKDTPALILILDGVQDPHNLGACLRTANAFNVDLVIAPKDNAVGITPIVRKVACGAAEHTPFIAVTNLSRCIKRLQAMGVWIYGTEMSAEQPIAAADLTSPTAIVMGSEAQGLRRLTKNACDHLVSIPMSGDVESLNVSVSAAICLYEAVRQRKIPT